MGEQAKGKGKQALEATKELRKLASEVVSFHFCQIDNSVTCMVGEWVHSLSAQLAQAPALAAYHQLLSTDHSLRSRLSLSQCNSDPQAALLQGILQPLTILKQGGKITEDRCVILIDALIAVLLILSDVSGWPGGQRGAYFFMAFIAFIFGLPIAPVITISMGAGSAAAALRLRFTSRRLLPDVFLCELDEAV